MLNQGEVDQLVEEARGAESGTAAEPAPADGSGPRPYDFRRPAGLSKDQAQALELVHRALADRLTSYLSLYLRTDLRCEVEALRQGPIGDLFTDLGAPLLYHLVRAEPLAGPFLFVLSADLTWYALERLLGGGETSAPPEGRELSEIACGLVVLFAERVLGGLPHAWSKVASLEPHIEETTANAQWVRMTLGQGEAVLVTLGLHEGEEVHGRFSFLWPVEALKPVAGRLDPKAWMGAAEAAARRQDSARAIRHALAGVSLPVRVTLGEAEIAFDDWIRLKPGDVLRLNRRVYDPLPVLVAGAPRLLGRAGQVGGLLAVRVESWVPPEGMGGEHNDR